MALLLFLAPLFLIYEVWQLVMAERYLGLKQIARDADPRTLGLRELPAAVWSLALIGYVLWMIALGFFPLTRLHALSLLLIWGVGFALRRNSPLKWVLVILTFEGAVRIGLLISLGWLASRRL